MSYPAAMTKYSTKQQREQELEAGVTLHSETLASWSEVFEDSETKQLISLRKSLKLAKKKRLPLSRVI